jgi:hypothetical protein
MSKGATVRKSVHPSVTAQVQVESVTPRPAVKVLRDQLNEIDGLLEDLSPTERSRELQAQAQRWRRAIATWGEAAVLDDERGDISIRVAKLLEEARVANQRIRGPHSQQIRIV